MFIRHIVYLLAAGLLLCAFAGCQTQGTLMGDALPDRPENLSASRYSQLLRAAKHRERPALVDFIHTAYENPGRAQELGYPRHLLELARLWGDDSFAEAIAVLSERERISLGRDLVDEIHQEFTAAFSQTLSDYHLSRTTFSIPSR